MHEIIIFGTGPIAVQTYYNFTEFSDHSVVAFCVDNDYRKEDTLFGKPVVSFETVQDLYSPLKYKMFVAMSFSNLNKNRQKKYNEAKAKGYELVSFVHPKAAVYSDLLLGDNCFVASCVSIQPKVKIGDNVFIRENCNIGHDTFIESHCYIGGGSSVSGFVSIKNNVFLGKGAIIRNSVSIAEKCIIGAGVTMLESSAPNEVYVAPKPIKLPFSSEGFL